MVNERLLFMRPVIFASLALALGTASLSSYAACTTRDEYNQSINQLQANYSAAVGAANRQYADKNVPNVVFVDLSRSSARRYNDAAFYYAEMTKKRANWENWEKASVGSEEAPIEGLASVRRSNGTCSFPAFRFHEWLREIRREGISETRLTSLNSPKSRLVGYSFQPVFRHRLARCDHSLRTIHPSSWWKRFLTWERQ